MKDSHNKKKKNKLGLVPKPTATPRGRISIGVYGLNTYFS